MRISPALDGSPKGRRSLPADVPPCESVILGHATRKLPFAIVYLWPTRAGHHYAHS